MTFFHIVFASPTLAFVLLVIGVLGIYREFLNPGRVIPGLVGLALTVIAVYGLVRNGPTAIGLTLIGVAILFFIVETIWDLRFLPGIVGTLFLIDGFRRLIAPPLAISLPIAVIGSIILGGVTTLLAFGARRARQNKWSDIPPAG